MNKQMPDAELAKLISKFLSDLEVIQHYDTLLKKISEARPDFRLLFMHTLHDALQHDFLTRLLRAFDPGAQGYNVRKVLEQRNDVASPILEAYDLSFGHLEEFEKKIKDFRNKYFFHTDEVTASIGFNPKSKYWDSQKLSVSVIMEIIHKTNSVLVDFEREISKNTTQSSKYTGDDFARLLDLIDEKGFEYFYLAKTDSQ